MTMIGHYCVLRWRRGAPLAPAIPILIGAVKDVSEDQRNAARALATFGPEAESALPALLDLLANRWDDDLRHEAIVAIQNIASEKSAILLAGLENPNPNIRRGVATVLGHFSGAVPVLTEALNDPSARVRLAAVSSLRNVNGSASVAMPHIRRLLQDDSRTVRDAAAKTLIQLEGR